jgi:hypothetical protein
MSQRNRRINNDIQKSSRQLQGYIYAIQDSRLKPLVANNENKINTPLILLKHHDRWPYLNPPRKLQSEKFWHRSQIWLDCEQQLEIANLGLLWGKYDHEMSTTVKENFLRSLTVICTPLCSQQFRSSIILKSTGLLEFLGWSDLSNLEILNVWV